MYRLFEVNPRGFVSFLGPRDPGFDSRELKVTTIPKKTLLVISARGWPCPQLIPLNPLEKSICSVMSECFLFFYSLSTRQ